MKKSLMFLCAVILLETTFAQNIHFIKSYGNTGYDYGRDIKQTPDTGYIATGSSSSFVSGTADAYLLKVDSLGNFQWSYNYGGNDSEWGNSVIVSFDSSYAIGGYTNSFGAGGFDFYLVRTNQLGVPMWQKTYGGSNWDKADALVQVPQDSGFVIVGETYSFGAGSKDIYIVRADKNGDTLWTKTYGGSQDDWATGVLIDGDSIAVCGGTKSFGAGLSDGIILKMDLNGNIGWTKIVGKGQDDYFTNIIKSSFFYALSGTKSYTYSTDFNDFWIYKIFPNGAMVIADTTWDGDQFGHDIANDLVIDAMSNEIYYGGSTTSWGSADVASNITDCFISKLDFGYSWMPYVQNFGDIGTDAIYGMDFCLDKGLVAIGDLDKYSTGGNNVLIVKIDQTNSFGYITVFADVIFEDITLDLAQDIQNQSVVIYPNPFQQEITIKGINPNTKLAVFDLNGRLVYLNSNFDENINFENLESGTYLFELTQDNEVKRLKVVKL